MIKVTKDGMPFKDYYFDTDLKIFAAKEEGLKIVTKLNNITFKTNSNCSFNTGAYCSFKTNSNCSFTTGPYCIFITDSYCEFTTGSCCVFNTIAYCSFDTGSYCTFNTDFHYKFKNIKNLKNCFHIDRSVQEQSDKFKNGLFVTDIEKDIILVHRKMTEN